MSEKKKSFQEFLANDALNPGVEDKKLQKVNVDKREVEAADDFGKECNAKKTVAPKIKKKPVGLFFLLGAAFLGLTIGLSFITPWCLFGIIPTLLCWWKMVINNGDNNLKSVVYRYDNDYFERIDGKEKEKQKCQEIEEELEEKKEEEKKKFEAKKDEEENEVDKNEEKNKRNCKKNSKSNDKDEDEIDNLDDDDEDEEEDEEKEKDKDDDKKKKKAERSNYKFHGQKVEKNSQNDVNNDNSKTSLIERNKRMRGQRAMY